MIIAGIGARVTPEPVLAVIGQAGLMLASRGIRGRSGCATGADEAFQRGMQLINPALFKGYPANIGHYIEWQEHAARYHPNWSACDDLARKAHGRNSAIMLGDAPISTPEPVDGVLCWTEGGAVTGGTGQALRIANDPMNAIPVFNLAVHSIDQFWQWVDAHA